MATKTPCALCGLESVAVFHLDRGCVARPDLTVQPLCLHHYVRSTPLGGYEMIEDLTPDQGFSRWMADHVAGRT